MKIYDNLLKVEKCQPLKISKNSFKCRISLLAFAFLTLFCVLFSSFLPALAQKNVESSDLVFCPLQKTWVKRNSEQKTSPKIEEPLGEICSSEKQKRIFFLELSKTFNFRQIISAQNGGEKIFF